MGTKITTDSTFDRSYRRVSKVRFIAFMSWSFAVALVCYALWRIETQTLSPKQGVVVAKIEKFNGSVRVKPADSIVWIEAYPNQPLYDGDIIATSFSSKAMLVLADKESINMGESSMLGISSKKNDGIISQFSSLFDDHEISGGARKVSVYKGNVFADRSKSEKENSLLSAMGINSGSDNDLDVVAKGESFRVDDGGKLGVTVLATQDKALISSASGLGNNEDSAQQFKAKELEKRLADDAAALGLHALNSENPGVLKSGFEPMYIDDSSALQVEKASVNPLVAAAKDAAKKKLEDEAKAKALQESRLSKDMVPKILSASARRLWYWNNKHLTTLPPISIEIDVPNEKNMNEYIPFIELVSGSYNIPVRVSGVSAKGKQTLALPTSQLLAMLSDKSMSTVVRVRAGILSLKSLQVERGDFSSEMKFENIERIAKGPITVRMQDLAWKVGANPTWIETSARGQLTHDIFLSDGRMLAKLLPMLRAATSFEILPGAREHLVGLQFVSDDEVVGALYSKVNNLDIPRRIAGMLRANFAFRGKSDDLLQLPAAGRNRLGVVEANVKKYGTVSVISRQRVLTVTAGSFEDNSGVLSAMGSNINAALRGKVAIEFIGH